MIFPHWPQDHCCSPYRALNHPCDRIKSDLISVHPLSDETFTPGAHHGCRSEPRAEKQKILKCQNQIWKWKQDEGLGRRSSIWKVTVCDKNKVRECAKSDSSNPTSLYSHETESRSQQFLLLSVLRNPGLVGSPETSRGNIDWKAKLNEYCSISGSWVVYGHLCHQQSDYCLQENPTWFEADKIW